MRRRADRQTAYWAFPGVWAYVVVMVVFGLMSGWADLTPTTFWVLVTAMVVIAAIRTVWTYRFEGLYKSLGPPSWRIIFAATSFAAAGIWGLTTALVLVDLGVEFWSLVGLLISVTFITIASLVYGHDWRWIGGFFAAMAGPPVWVLWGTGGPEATTLLVFTAIYVVYTSIQSHRFYKARWRYLKRGRLVELRADELRRARDAAQAADRTKMRFLAHMSHELRTPLTSIVGLAERLETPELPVAERRRAADSLHAAADLLLSLIDDVLDLARYEDGRVSLHPTAFDLRALVDGVVDLLLPRARQKDLVFGTAVASHLPERFIGDPDRLRQVLINLIGNAIKYTEHGSVRLEVKAAADVDERYGLRFLVRDTGRGIAPEKRAAVFEPFVQTDPSGAHQGVGLGLAISRRIVEQMGGEIDVDEVEGGGSIFHFTIALPLAAPRVDRVSSDRVAGDRVAGDRVSSDRVASSQDDEPDSMVATETATAPNEATAVASSPPAQPIPDGTSVAPILVVEDNDLNRELFVRQLDMLGWRAEAVADGESALDLIASGRSFDLILMDCQMPGIDGYETCRRLRLYEQDKGHAPVPVISVTAYAFPEDQQNAANAGMNDWLTKPFRLQDLGKKVERWMPSPPTAQGM
ncbi:MAG: ATP-binding protein [Acidobacteriota bacterium]